MLGIKYIQKSRLDIKGNRLEKQRSNQNLKVYRPLNDEKLTFLLMEKTFILIERDTRFI